MTLAAFEESLQASSPPADLSPALQALWHDGRGDWDRAHDVAQEIDDATGARVHAYLHRKEGDESNARYWYRQAGATAVSGSLDAEWRAMVEALLARPD